MLNLLKVSTQDIKKYLDEIFNKSDSLTYDRKIHSLRKFFSWANKNDADLAIRRVGGTAGKAYSPDNTCELSHYYIRCDNIENVKNCLNSIDWLEFSDKTTGPRSISKPELVYLFEKNYSSKTI